MVIPALNEAANLPHVLSRLPAFVDEVVLVDGHSIDDTVEVARAIRPDVRIVIQDGRGKGNALACGFAAARGDIIVMLDADGSNDPAEIVAFVDALLAGNDFAKGSRFAPGGASSDITTVRRAGNRALSMLVNLLFGTRYSDLCYGYNAFWRHCLAHMHVTCDGFEVETLINVRVARAGLSVIEVASVEHARLHGESKLHAVRDGLRVLRTILGERMRPHAVVDPETWQTPRQRAGPRVADAWGSRRPRSRATRAAVAHRAGLPDVDRRDRLRRRPNAGRPGPRRGPGARRLPVPLWRWIGTGPTGSGPHWSYGVRRAPLDRCETACTLLVTPAVR